MKDTLSVEEVFSGTGIPEDATVHDFEWTADGLEVEWSVEE